MNVIPRPPSTEHRAPNALILGAAKAGTTAVFSYLTQHPDVFGSSVRETNYFALGGEAPAFGGPGDDRTVNRNSVYEQQAYAALFDEAGDASVCMESSPWYLYHPEAAERIAQALPGAKCIVLLRDPVERAYASYLHLVRDGREKLETFEQALEAEPARIEAGWEHLWHYASMGFYGTQLKRYLNTIPREQVFVGRYTAFKEKPIGFMQDIFQFLDIDAAFVPDITRKPNASGWPRSKTLQRWIDSEGVVRDVLVRSLPERIRARGRNKLATLNLKKPPLDDATRQRLIARYRDDVLELQALISQDLSAWLQ